MSIATVLAELDQWGFAAARYLFSATWQSSLLLGAAGALAWALRRRRPQVVLAVWLGALLAAPWLPLLTRGARRAGVPQASVAVLPVYEPPAGRAIGQIGPMGPIGPIGPMSRMREGGTEPVGGGSGAVMVDAPGLAPLDYPWALGLLVYGAGLAGALGLVALGRARLREWVRSAAAVEDAGVRAIFEEARAALGMKRGCAVLESPRVPAPLSLGIARPRVLLPAGLAARLGREELRAVALHELAHLRRRDPLWLTLAILVRGVLYFHPLAWLAARQVAALAEHCADAAVLEAGCPPLPYARLLTRLAEEVAATPRPAALAAAGLVFSREAFLRRIEAILGGRGRLRRMTRLGLAATGLALGASLVAALAFPLIERGPKMPALYEVAKASSPDLRVKAGPNRFFVSAAARNDAEGRVFFEDGRGNGINSIGFPVDPSLGGCGAWMDAANVYFGVESKSQQSHLLFDVIETRVFDHATRRPITEGRLAAGWDLVSDGVIQLRSIGRSLPETVDVWMRANSYKDTRRVMLRPTPGVAAAMNGGSLRLREVLPGSWSYRQSGSNIEWSGQPQDRQRAVTIALDWSGEWNEGWWQICAVDKGGRRIFASVPHFLDFKASRGQPAQVIQFQVPLEELDHFELRPFGGRHTFYFDGVKLPKVGGRKFSAMPAVQFDVSGQEMNAVLKSDALAPLRVAVESRRGKGGGVSAVVDSARAWATFASPPQDPEKSSTLILNVEGINMGSSNFTLRLFDREGKAIPEEEIHERGRGSAATHRSTVRIFSQDIPLERIGVAELRLGEAVETELKKCPSAATALRLQLRLVARPEERAEAERVAFLDPRTRNEDAPEGWLEKTILFSERDFVMAETRQTSGSRDFQVFLQMTPEAARRFAEVTKKNIKRRLAIVFDGRVITAPVIQTAITGGRLTITGNFTRVEAETISEAVRKAGVAGNAAVKPAFGPVIERTVNQVTQGCFIDLDSGRLFDDPMQTSQSLRGNAKRTLQWCTRNGIDAGGCPQPPVRGLEGMDVIASPLTGESWETMTPERLAKPELFRIGKPGFPVYLSAKEEVPATYMFKTREGAIGLLQIAGFNDQEPRGVRIRYKLVNSEN